MDNPVARIVLIAPVLLFSMVAHEYAHGWVALRNGDPTAYQLGRLTWNPVKHIDPFMTILLPGILILTGSPVVLGGAKPVPVNPRNYRNFRRGDILVSLAGITTNAILAVICALLVPLLYGVGVAIPAAIPAAAVLQHMFIYGVWLNLALAAFNLLPIPPLDGSHVFKYVLPPAWALAYARIARYGLVILYALLFFGGSVLMVWFAPAFALSDHLLGAVARYVFPLSGALGGAA